MRDNKVHTVFVDCMQCTVERRPPPAPTPYEGTAIAPCPIDRPGRHISGGHLVAKALKAEGVERHLHALRRPHHRHLRRLRRRGHRGHRRPPRAGRRPRRRRLRPPHREARVRGGDRGPGTTDAVTGVANAFRAESPMLLIGGQGAHTQHKMGSLQDLPHVDMMAPITKFAATVPDTARAADMVSMAFRECYHGAPGPSFLEIPRDVLDAKVPATRRGSRRRAHYRASTRNGRRPRGRREAGRPARARRAAGHPAGQPGLDVPRRPTRPASWCGR